MAEQLKQQQCVPCQGDVPPLKRDEIEELVLQVPDWMVVVDDEPKRLQRTLKFKDFPEALQFVNHLGEIAEDQGHHPRLIVDYKEVTIEWWTHAIDGLHKNDFIMAARTDDAYKRWPEIMGRKDMVQETSEESFPASDPPARY